MITLSQQILKSIKEAVARVGGQTSLADQMNTKQPQINKYINGPSKIENMTLSTFERYLPFLENVKVYVNDINIVDNTSIKAEANAQVVTGTNIQYAKNESEINSTTGSASPYNEKINKLESDIINLEDGDPLTKLRILQLIKENRG